MVRLRRHVRTHRSLDLLPRMKSSSRRCCGNSCRVQGGTPPECTEVGDDAGIRRRKSDATVQRRLVRRPLRASRRLKRNRRVTAPRAVARCTTDAPWRGLGGEHDGRKRRSDVHGRRHAGKWCTRAPVAENKPSASFQWMQPEARAVPAGPVSAETAIRATGCAIQTRCRGAATGAHLRRSRTTTQAPNHESTLPHPITCLENLF